MKNFARIAVLSLLALFLAPGCGGSDADPLEIAGHWIDDWDFTHVITQDSWSTMDSVFHITQYDNPSGFLIAHNDASNQYNPDKWSRFDWTTDVDQALHFCQITFDAASENEALAATGANRSDLATGCGGFGWSKLTPN